jgi:hypothetical protein
MAIDARRRFKHAFAGGRGRLGQLLLLMNPPLEFLARLHVDPQQHLGVLSSTTLCALPQKQSRFMRIDPHLIRVIRNQVGLASQSRHPEAVVCVGGEQCQECGCRMCWIADRHMQFIRRHDIQAWIAVLPPILMPGDDDLDRVLRPRRILNGPNYASRGQERRQNDKNWDNGPGQFYLRAPLDLSGLGAEGALAPESHDRVGK